MSGPAHLKAGGIEVVYERQRDRFAHGIYLLGNPADDCRVLLLRSVEGTDQDEWPASPPAQSVDVHDISPNSSAILTIGMAGRGHWSSSCNLNESGDALVFDLACRTAQPPTWLGSSYSPATGVTMKRVANDGDAMIVELSSAEISNPVRLRISSTGSIELRITADPNITNLNGAALVLQPPSSTWQGVATIRWRYSLQLLND